MSSHSANSSPTGHIHIIPKHNKRLRLVVCMLVAWTSLFAHFTIALNFNAQPVPWSTLHRKWVNPIVIGLERLYSTRLVGDGIASQWIDASIHRIENRMWNTIRHSKMEYQHKQRRTLSISLSLFLPHWAALTTTTISGQKAFAAPNTESKYYSANANAIISYPARSNVCIHLRKVLCVFSFLSCSLSGEFAAVHKPLFIAVANAVTILFSKEKCGFCSMLLLFSCIL